MLKFLQKIKLENLKKVMLETWRRAPLAMLISLAAFTLIVVQIRVEDISKYLEDNIDKAIFTLAVTFSFQWLCICILKLKISLGREEDFIS